MKNTAFKVSKGVPCTCGVPNDKDACDVCVIILCVVLLFYFYLFCCTYIYLCSLHLNMSVFLKTFGKFS